MGQVGSAALESHLRDLRRVCQSAIRLASVRNFTSIGDYKRRWKLGGLEKDKEIPWYRYLRNDLKHGLMQLRQHDTFPFTLKYVTKKLRAAVA